jgi:ferric-dicitrate binding protein FerR (iron transport regulator)
MDQQLPDNDQQIASFLSGNSSSSEMEELQNWQTQSASNRNIFDNASRIWENAPLPLTKSVIEHDKITVKGQIITQMSLLRNHDRIVLKFLRIAAILIGPVMLAIGWYIGSHNSSEKIITWNSVTAPRKHIAMCTMADGTEVWLNAGSTISYPTTDSPGKREVKLNGEGYFKVAKNTKKPFFVITKEVNVKVLGTSFNIKAYSEEETITTTLEEGSVELFTIKSGNTPDLLHPGEQATYHISDGKNMIAQVDAARFSAWRNDKFLFKDADLKTIITELERLYDIKIHIVNPKLEKLRFRGMFCYDQDLLDAFETLRRSVKLNYTIKDREVWLE